VEDPHRKPGDRDRSSLVARIQRAADEGRIVAADRDIRLANVASAQSMSELDLIGRELDQLEAAVPSGSTSAQPWAAPAGVEAGVDLGEQVTDHVVTAARSTVRSVGVLVILLLVLAGVGGGAAAFFRSGGGSGTATSSDDGLFTPEPIPTDVTSEPSDGVDGPSGDEPPGGSAYALDPAGIRSFITGYRKKFDTTLVVDLVMYDSYAVVQVPQSGTKRHAGFLYRRGEGWQDFGGIQANFPGSEPVDLRRLDVDALVRNIAEARRTLNVQDVSQTYAIVHHYSSAEDRPSVDIHVANEYGESGYLDTRLDGSVERAFPYAG
jgi:hypothetical protein